MEIIYQELDKFNSLFELDNLHQIPMKKISDSQIENLSKLQKYELELNQIYLPINSYENLTQSIIIFPELTSYELSPNELIKYIQKRVDNNCSVDRIYFFNELIFSFVNQKEKKYYIKQLILSLKNCIYSKSKEKYDLDLLLRLLARFIVISTNFKFIEKDFINEILDLHLKRIDVKQEFYISMYFYEFIFSMYNKKNIFFNDIVLAFDEFVHIVSEEILTDTYKPYRKFAYKIGKVYKTINNYSNQMIFYKREIDNTISYCKDISIDTMNKQSIVNEALNIAKVSNYKLSELKSLAKNISTFIASNYDKFFQVFKDEELSEKTKDYFEFVEVEFNSFVSLEEKMEYLFLYIYHFSFSESAFKNFMNNQENRNGFFRMFFLNSQVIDHKGYSYKVMDNEKFTYFQCTIGMHNNLSLYLDYKFQWTEKSKDLIVNKIKSLRLLDENFILQYQSAINLFVNKQYIEFMYIAPTLIEIILKNFLYKINGELLSVSGENIVEKSMTQVIDELIKDKDCYLDNIMLEYIAHILVSKEGLNLRNNISHGNFTDKYFNKSNSMYIYMILIYLIQYFVNDEKE